MFIVHPRF